MLQTYACTQKLKMGRLVSESDMAGLTYGETKYSEATLRWGEPDSIIIKDSYFLATWRGAAVESVGISMGGVQHLLLGTTAEGSFRNVTIVFERNNMTYMKYIIDTDPISNEKWVGYEYWY